MRTEDCQRHNGPNSWMFYFWSTVMQTVLGVVFEGRNCALDNLLSETCLFSFISVPSTDRQASYNSSMVATAIINQTARLTLFIMMMMVIIIIIIIIVSLLLLSSLLSIEPPRLILDDEGKWFESIMIIMNIIVIRHHRNYHHHHHHSRLAETISTQSECDLFGKYHHCHHYPMILFSSNKDVKPSYTTRWDL